MSVELVLEVNSHKSAQAVFNALDAYKAKLRASIQHTHRNLKAYEQGSAVTTAVFHREMTAECLTESDLKYVEWAGEAKLLEGLETELKALEEVRYKFPGP